MKKKILITLLSLVIATIMLPRQVFAETTQNSQSERTQEEQVNSNEPLEITAKDADTETVPTKDNEGADDYLSFTAKGGAATIQLTNNIAMSLKYSFDKDSWEDFVQGLGTEQGVTVSEDQTVYLRLADGADPVYPAQSTSIVSMFTMTGSVADTTVEAGGNIMSLVSHDITTADTIEQDYGFSRLFSACKIMTTPPKLPATTLAVGCYYQMFKGSGITSAPDLPAKELKDNCYQTMFAECASLETPPKMLAETLAEGCCANMFSACASLTAGPELFATELKKECYKGMFSECSNLNEITVHFEEWGGVSSFNTYEWVDGVASTGTFYCPASLPKEKNKSRIPVNWTIQPLSEGYTITKGISDHVNAFTLPEKAEEDAKVDLPAVTTESGFEFKGWHVTDADGDPVTVEGDSSSGYYFTMPAKDVTVVAAVTKYKITTPAVMEGVKEITDFPEFEEPGKTVNFDVEPEEGYIVEKIEYSHPETGEKVTVDAEETGLISNYSFEMPMQDILVTPVMQREGADDYLSFTARGGDALIQLTDVITMELEYRLGKEGGWLAFTQGTSPGGVNVSEDSTVYLKLKGNTPVYPGQDLDTFNSFVMSGGEGVTVEAGGNIMSLVSNNLLEATAIEQELGFLKLFYNCKILKTSPSLPAITLTRACYREMFYGSGITSTPELPAMELANNCYAQMFRGCKSLTEVKELPATTMQTACYQAMFTECESLEEAPELLAEKMEQGCYSAMFANTGITNAPELNATELAKSCYEGMFQNCKSLETPPELPAEKMADWCYESMFASSGITEAPELNATELADKCYSNMFSNCKSLETPPILPADKLATKCYASMFMSCTSLDEAPELSATVMKEQCYASMFSGCSSLETPPVLSAEELSSRCYESMFKDSGIKEAPVLPATEMKQGCYWDMFDGCTSLEEAPELPAKELVSDCYGYMFDGCSSLGLIKAYFTDWQVESGNAIGTTNWVRGVASTGTFYCPDSLVETSGDSYIPTGWDVVKGHDIELPTLSHGTATATVGSLSVESAFKDDTVQLTYTATDPGWEVSEWKVTKKGEPSTTVTVTGGKFTMPDYPITVTAIETQIDYTITIEGPQHGSTTAKVNDVITATAHFGDKVSLNTSMEPGYELKKYIVTEVEGGAIPVDYEGTFTMPLSDVNVQVEETAIQPPVPIDNPTIEEISATGDNATCEIMLIVIASFALAVVLLRNKDWNKMTK